MRRRSRARAWALKVLYAWETSGRPLVGVREEFFAGQTTNPGARAFAERLLDTVERELPQIDALLRERAAHWSLERMAAVDRNILRIGAAELLHMPDIPTRVAIDEAIELARRYGSDDSPKFVNGLLDALLPEACPR